MSAVLSSLKLARQQPFGCLVSVIFSAILVGAAALAIACSLYAMMAVGLIKGALQNSTGFYADSDSIFVNMLTGNCSIRNLRIDNPYIYGAREYYERSGDVAKPFLIASRVGMKISPMQLLLGKFAIYSLDMEISQLNCVRLNNSAYNLSEFLDGISKQSAFAQRDGRAYISSFSISIDKVSYRDLSSPSDIIKYDGNAQFKFSRSDVSEMPKLLSELEANLAENKMGFVAKGFNVLNAQAK